MKRNRKKRPRIRLAPNQYRELCGQVLERDGWRCQSCGSTNDLQVHHLRFRNHLGDDSEENLITLCYRCHLTVHHRRS